ncbi:hypothetical protein [Pontibacter sp. SGAir0037]|uniref:hypothetical protein n=1 Tax=Pontibacter sp. SGAir0037 TaxID=2571030 RepID=UPI0010CD3F30|nr:hypothetical protein [Pontibacter sp. SGAir0037]QCR21823.1 hypothetical protein C1N53_05385 [Pontibacter sp. SGAir0037]
MHPYVINSVNALVLVAAGLLSYFLDVTKPPTALIPPAIGFLLLACSYHLSKSNRFVLHTVTALTVLLATLLLLQLDFSTFSWSWSELLLLLMGISCLVTAVALISSYFRKA